MTMSFGVAALAAAAPVFAATCDSAVTDLSFGRYSRLSGPIDSSATISVTCVPDAGAEVVSYSVAISPGLAGTYRPRQMTSGEGRLEYNVYTDGARSLVWGDGTAGTLTVDAQLVLPAQSRRDLVVFGRIPAGQSVPPGTYDDVLTITVQY